MGRDGGCDLPGIFDKMERCRCILYHSSTNRNLIPGVDQ